MLRLCTGAGAKASSVTICKLILKGIIVLDSKDSLIITAWLNGKKSVVILAQRGFLNAELMTKTCILKKTKGQGTRWRHSKFVP